MKITFSLTLESDMTPQEAAAITAKISEQTSVIEAAIALINATKGDPAALQAILDQIGASTTALNAAVVAGTPAA